MAHDDLGVAVVAALALDGQPGADGPSQDRPDVLVLAVGVVAPPTASGDVPEKTPWRADHVATGARSPFPLGVGRWATWRLSWPTARIAP